MKRKEFIQKSALAASVLSLPLISVSKVFGSISNSSMLTDSLRSVWKVVSGETVNVSPTLKVMRTIPFAGRNVIDPFVLLDHVGPRKIEYGEHMGVPPHPHRGFEPVTFLFEGNVDHRDSLGNYGKLNSGDIQWMTAGEGIVHAEDMGKRFGKEGGIFNGVQLWVNLPKKKKLMSPGYQNIQASKIPIIEKDGGKAKVRVIAGRCFEHDGPTVTQTPIMALNIILEPGSEVTFSVPSTHNAFVQILEGKLKIGQGKVAKQADLVLFEKDGNKVHLKAITKQVKPANLLFLSGEPINEPIFQYGPFVMTNRDEIRQAYEDYSAGKMGHLE